jgi:hypothetical protein
MRKFHWTPARSASASLAISSCDTVAMSATPRRTEVVSGAGYVIPFFEKPKRGFLSNLAKPRAGVRPLDGFCTALIHRQPATRMGGAIVLASLLSSRRGCILGSQRPDLAGPGVAAF